MVLFIFENIENYIKSSKQQMLYKILNMMTVIKIPFVFVATTPAIDVEEQFEKRIKSRFSHSSILLYEQKLETFVDTVHKSFSSFTDEVWKEFILGRFFMSVPLLEELNDRGRDVLYFIQILKICFANLYTIEPYNKTEEAFIEECGECFDKQL